MILFALSCSRCSGMDIEENSTRGFIISLQIGPFVTELWLHKKEKRP